MKIFHVKTLIILLYISNTLSLAAEITEAKVKIGGIVCVACISPIKKALKGKVRAISAVPNINITDGLVEIKLKKNNKISISKLQEQLRNSIKKSTYKLESISEISLKGIPSKENNTLQMTISGSKEVIQLSSDFENQIKEAIEKKKEITISGILFREKEDWILKKTE